MTFGERMAEARKEKGLTQKELAHKLNVSPMRISHYESDNREPDISTIKKISSALEVRPDWLLGLSDKKITANNDDDLSIADKRIKVDDRLLDALQAQVTLLSDRLAKSDEQLAIKDEQLNVKDIQIAEKDRQRANADARLQEAHVLAKNVQDKLPQLAAPSESEPPASEQPVKQKWYQRLFVRRKSTK